MRRIYKYITFLTLNVSAIGKLIDPSPATKVISMFFNDESLHYHVFYKIIVLGLSIYEIILSIYLLLTKNKISIIVCNITFGFFLVVLISYPIRSIDIQNCGCYGNLFPVGSLWFAVTKNIVFLLWGTLILKENNKTHKSI